MNPPILHHYPVSPFAEKIRVMLAWKKLAWQSVLIPMIMPKPDLMALTGGYRRTPVLQTGADLWCDTALIARVLERLAPKPSLFPDGDTLAVQALAYFADSVMFNITVPVGFQPGGGMLKLFVPEASPDFLTAFGKDRAAMRQGGTVRRGPLAECKANMQGLLPKVEAQLRKAYLLGDAPCAADFSLYHVLWPVWKVPETRGLLDAFPKTVAFIERMAAFGQGTFTEISSAQAIDIARAAQPAPIAGAQAVETGGIALGETVNVMPVDTALDPVRGELLQCSADEIAVRRSDPRAGTVVVHFPRFGFQVAKAS
ncbi:MAG TPA: glutathione S-transferase family protein [Burkholderiales bacterium]|nr:glutathione S-transferase family protein [Burkholderiales bacterium]